LERSLEEEKVCNELTEIDDKMISLRETIRNGGMVGSI
jgi:hypothetical protein